VTIPTFVAVEPISDRRLIQVNENPFAELLDCGKPIGILRQRGTAYREPDIFEIAVSARRGGFEPGEAIEARDLAQPMNRDHVLD
jgi:hypothetical protein